MYGAGIYKISYITYWNILAITENSQINGKSLFIKDLG